MGKKGRTGTKNGVNNHSRHPRMGLIQNIADQTSGETASVVPIARIERPQAFSLEGGLDWSPTARVQRGSSETARCTSTGDHLVRPLILLPSLLVPLLKGVVWIYPLLRALTEHGP